MRSPASLLEARHALDVGDLTAMQLLDAHLERIAHQEPSVQAITTTTFELAREHAAKADARRRAGERGPVLGIPLVLKDLIDVAGVVTTAGSRLLEDNVAAASATVWTRLEAAGAVLVGKANTHEFAYGGTTEPTRNPADLTRIVGGSSGGPAAALAAGYCLAAVGSDTAGSIRIPANLCGVAGLKPTRGLVPSGGVIPLSPSLDVVGPMARRVADLAPVLQVMADLDGPPDLPGAARRVGVLRNAGPMADSVAQTMRTAAAGLSRLGIEVVECRIDGFEGTVFDNFTVIGYEATAFHARWADKRELYSPYVRDRLAQAASVTATQYAESMDRATTLAAQLDQLLEGLDALLAPGVPFPASPAYDERVLVAQEWEDRDTALCRNTAFANLTGHPALAVPAGLDGVLPVGVQLIGRHGADLDLVALGARLEELLPPALPDHLVAVTPGGPR